MRIGVLALQGAFIEHEAMLEKLGAEVFEIRKLSDIGKPFDGLILPGGESTVQGKLMKSLGLFEPIRSLIENGLPVMGTCAGMIMLAKHLEGDSTVHLGLMDITVKRNAYGRQLGSFTAHGNFADCGEIEMPFIRAPYITDAGKDVDVLSRVNGNIVAARERNMIALSFHPEVTEDLTVHRYFLGTIPR